MKYIICFFAILFVWSCDTKDLEEIRAFPEDALEAPVVQSMETVVIDQDSYDAKELVTFSWQPANFGYSAAANYSIYMSSGSVSDYAFASNVKAASFTIDHQALYGTLVSESGLALPVDDVSTVTVYVTATVGSDFEVVKSAAESVTFDISLISMDGDLLSIAGDHNGWLTARTALVGLDKVYKGYVDMNWNTNVNYKFVDKKYSATSAGDWYGGALATLSTSGGNLTATPGMKYFNVNLNTNAATIVNFTKVGLTGVNGSWGTPTVEMSYDYTKKYYSLVYTVNSGNFRILCAPGWSYTMGPKTPGELTLSPGKDVKVYDSNSISKPLLGKDPNMTLTVPGTYRFILYYSAVEATWHFKVENP